MNLLPFSLKLLRGRSRKEALQAAAPPASSCFHASYAATRSAYLHHVPAHHCQLLSAVSALMSALPGLSVVLIRLQLNRLVQAELLNRSPEGAAQFRPGSQAARQPASAGSARLTMRPTPRHP